METTATVSLPIFALLVGLRLLAYPLLVEVMAIQVFALQALWARVTVIGLDRVSTVVLLSTLASVVTVSVVLALLLGP